MEIIGLSGYARSGKDEAAKLLVNGHGFTRVAFADKLRECLYQLNPMCGRGWDTSDRPVVYVQDVIEEYGWDGYKETEYGIEIRRLLQRLGTEAGRQTLWDSIWIDAAFAPFGDDAKLVIPDCRFPNEAQAIEERGGEVWRVQRPGVGPANLHASETSLDDWPFKKIVMNSTTLDDLQIAVTNAYKDKV